MQDSEVYKRMSESELVMADHYAEIGELGTLRRLTDQKREELEAEDREREN